VWVNIQWEAWQCFSSLKSLLCFLFEVLHSSCIGGQSYLLLVVHCFLILHRHIHVQILEILHFLWYGVATSFLFHYFRVLPLFEWRLIIPDSEFSESADAFATWHGWWFRVTNFAEEAALCCSNVEIENAYDLSHG